MRPGVSWCVLGVSLGVLGYPGVSWGNQTDPNCSNLPARLNKITTRAENRKKKLQTTYCSALLNNMAASATNRKKTLNHFSCYTCGWILKSFHRIVTWVTLYQNCSNHSAPLNKLAGRAKNRNEPFNNMFC